MKQKVIAMLIAKIEEYKAEGKTITAISLQKSLFDILERSEDRFLLDVSEITVPIHAYPDFCESYLNFRYKSGSEVMNVKIGWDFDRFEVVLPVLL